jgi:hypothetical protein
VLLIVASDANEAKTKDRMLTKTIRRLKEGLEGDRRRPAEQKLRLSPYTYTSIFADSSLAAWSHLQSSRGLPYPPSNIGQHRPVAYAHTPHERPLGFVTYLSWPRLGSSPPQGVNESAMKAWRFSQTGDHLLRSRFYKVWALYCAE